MSLHVIVIKSLFEKIRQAGFIERLFFWARIKNRLTDAFVSLASLENELANAAQNLTAIRMQQSGMEENVRQTNLKFQTLQAELLVLRERELQTQKKLQHLADENVSLKKDDAFRQQKVSAELSSLEIIRRQIQEERASEIKALHVAELERLNALKATWHAHQHDVKNRMKMICQKHTVNYVDKPSFKGDPDNTLFICDEHVIFDAKSPAGDDLNNFPTYLKTQAEAAKKYAKIEGVKKDIFLVVPANTLSVIKDFVYNLADYDVYIISTDALEPLILSLCKIEDYEFAEQLRPEDRENICRVIGKFAHLSKRRIQVDSFFAKQFIELAYKCENDLPADIHDKVLEFERSEKLNPPMEKRAKAISTKELDAEQNKIDADAQARGIALQAHDLSDLMNNVMLYK